MGRFKTSIKKKVKPPLKEIKKVSNKFNVLSNIHKEMNAILNEARNPAI